MSRAAHNPAVGRSLGVRGRLKAFFDERLGLDTFADLAAEKHVPVHRLTCFYFLGGMALFLFVIQIVTGILLALYYHPSPDSAYQSVQTIVTDVSFGWLMRAAHAWSANLLIGILFLHMATAFVMRAYRRPREITWVTGVVLWFVFLALGFSGYLLPWDQMAFFATRVGTSMAGAIPVIGDELILLARGGEDVSGATLSRFYGLHVSALPLLVIVVLAGHLFLVQKHGMSVPERIAQQYGGPKKVPSMPFVPHFLLRDMVGWYLALGLLAALAAVFGWELGDKADPFGATPQGIKPEWYFLAMYQTLKLLPSHILGIEGETVGVMGMALACLALVAIPFLDRGVRTRRLLNVAAVILCVYFVVMTIWGGVS